VSKPVKADELYAIIDQILTAEARSDDGTERIDVVDFMHGLDGDHAIIAEVVEILQQDYPKQLKTLRDAIVHGDAFQLAHTAHGLKGGVAVLGATTAYTLAAALESMGRNGHLAGALTTFEQLEHELARLVASFTDRLSDHPQP
jgi:HPt (histidine-containing phosphotransfer) domain-containing protein